MTDDAEDVARAVADMLAHARADEVCAWCGEEATDWTPGPGGRRYCGGAREASCFEEALRAEETR